MGIRYRVDPGDVPAEQAARRIGLTAAEFEKVKDPMFARGFPRPDQTTGLYDLDATNAWRRLRHPRLFQLLRGAMPEEKESACDSLSDTYERLKALDAPTTRRRRK